MKAYYSIGFVFALILVVGCNAPKETTAPLKSGLILANMDSTVKPGDNFQMFVNGKWIKNTEIPADKSSYGVGTMVNEQSQKERMSKRWVICTPPLWTCRNAMN
jgi:putative endopeptidase